MKTYTVLFAMLIVITQTKEEEAIPQLQDFLFLSVQRCDREVMALFNYMAF